MRIDPQSPVTGSAGTNRVDEGQSGQVKSSSKTATNEPTDTVQLSSGQATVRKLMSQLDQVPDIREGQVNSLRSAIGSGQYNPNNEQVAGAVAAQTLGIDGNA